MNSVEPIQKPLNFLSLTINIKHTNMNNISDILNKYIIKEKNYAISCETSQTHEHIHAGFYTNTKINTIRVYLLKKFKEEHLIFKDNKVSNKGGNHFLIIKLHDDADYFLGYIYKELNYKQIKTNIKEKDLKIKHKYYVSAKAQKKKEFTLKKSNSLATFLLKELEIDGTEWEYQTKIKLATFLIEKLIEKKKKEMKGLDPRIESRVIRLVMAITHKQYDKEYKNQVLNCIHV